MEGNKSTELRVVIKHKYSGKLQWFSKRNSDFKVLMNLKNSTKSKKYLKLPETYWVLAGKALTAMPDNQSWIPRSHMESQIDSWVFLWQPHKLWHTWAKHTQTKRNLKNKIKKQVHIQSLPSSISKSFTCLRMDF